MLGQPVEGDDSEDEVAEEEAGSEVGDVEVVGEAEAAAEGEEDASSEGEDDE